MGDPTIIVNNAGVVKGKLLLDLTEEDIKEYVWFRPDLFHSLTSSDPQDGYWVLDAILKGSTFGSNTLAHFWILKALLPALLRTGKGHIVTVSSIMGLVASAQMSECFLSKTGQPDVFHPTHI